MTILLFALLAAQDAPTVRLAPGPATERAWPIDGTVDLADGAALRLSAARVERRWDAKARRFEEAPSVEARVAGNAVVAGKAFGATLKRSAPGLYVVTVSHSGRTLHRERMILGRVPEFFPAAGRQAGKLADLADRMAGSFGEVEAVAERKLRPGPKSEKAFAQRVSADMQQLEDLGPLTDFTGTVGYLRDLGYHLLNAQVWGAAGGDDLENDGDAKLFLDSSLDLRATKALVASAKGVLSREARASAATVLDELFRRAADRPEKLLSRAREAAREALKVLRETPERDADFEGVLEALARGEPSEEDPRARLKAALGALVK